MAFDYMIPLSCGSCSSLLYLTASGFLNAEGRSYISGFISVSSSILNLGFLCPLFLLNLKVGIKGVALASMLSEGSAGILILVLYFRGKFTVKPKLSQLLNRFSSETWSALRVGLSSLAQSVSLEIPGILLRKLIGLACGGDTEKVANALSGLYILLRYLKITNAVVLAVSTGYVPAASYSYAGFMYNRWLYLSIYTLLIAIGWGLLTTILSWSVPKQISFIFSKDESLLEYSIPMLKYGNGLGFFSFSRFVIPSILQSLLMGIRATFLSLSSQLAGMLAFSYIMYLAYSRDPPKIVWCMSLSYALGVIVGIFFLWKPVKDILKARKEERVDRIELPTIVNEKEEENRYL